MLLRLDTSSVLLIENRYYAYYFGNYASISVAFKIDYFYNYYSIGNRDYHSPYVRYIIKTFLLDSQKANILFFAADAKRQFCVCSVALNSIAAFAPGSEEK